ncbi:unnamed protein product [Leptospira phage LE1]|uniref:Uncharacterized protein n=1 Tax=Leptospira phage LE1 TaxID=137511 RepID=Q6NDY2_9CAUD|nr:hypothetical protein HWD53_gp61 [Leptospira phage LE1]CAE14758.1 unnamed protein product [Leptospira phage LE1]
MSYHFCNVNFIREGRTIKTVGVNANVDESDFVVQQRALVKLKKDMIELKFDRYQVERVEP